MLGKFPNFLKVEKLNPRHLRMAASNQELQRLGWMQSMLFKGLIANAEVQLQELIPVRQPLCTVCIEKDKIISYLVVKPLNRRGTCWEISISDTLLKSSQYTYKVIYKCLLEYSLNIENIKTKSWVIKCPTNNTELLSTLRELGFQPLKIINSWSVDKEIEINNIHNINCLPKDIEWNIINKYNANELWRIEQANQSSNCRQIIDKRCIDLMDQKTKHDGLLISKNNSTVTAIAGFISTFTSNRNEIVLKLVRDLIWDERLKLAIPFIINKIVSSSKKLIIEVSNEDKEINNLFKETNWEISSEKILLGRTLWRREYKNKFIQNNSSIDSMLGKLKPNNTPLPSPVLNKIK